MAKIKCLFCSKKFASNWIKRHQQKCTKRPIPTVTVEAAEPPRNDYALGVKHGREDANNDLKQRLLSTYVDALKASATMLDAVAHIITERIL